MKKILLGVLLLMSFVSNAKVLNEIDNDEIIDAIVLSFDNNDLACLNTVGKNKFNASSLNLVGFLASSGKDYVLTIHQGKQPVIIIKKETNDNYNLLMKVTTNDDFTTVIFFEVLITQKDGGSKINVGTIIEPKYETMFKYVVTDDISCREMVD